LSSPTKSSKEAAKLGRSLPGLRPDWDQVKLATMKHVLLKKLEEHPHLKELLLSTGEEIIAELSYRDRKSVV
jgi:hypothetical protein